jgi:protocatechuate 3,4-dioxygenase beta subunit
VFSDVNENGTYELGDDTVLANATVAFSKSDTLNPELQDVYVISKEIVVDASGHYSVSGMMPGYYLVSVSVDDILIHQSSIYLLSGSVSWYNLSKVESAAFTGRTFVDANKDSQYTPGEELAQTTVMLSYQKYDETQVIIGEVVTNATGLFSFTNLIPGQYRFAAQKMNTTTGYRDYLAEGSLVFAENETKTLTIPLSLATVTVSGNITFENESKAGIILSFLANASVENNTAYPFLQVQSNQTGWFMIQLYPGHYNVSVNQTMNESGQLITYYFFEDIKLDIGQGFKEINIAVSTK